MTVSFEGIGENLVTFYNASSSAAAAGYPVSLSGSGTVAKTAAGGRFMGVCHSADTAFAAVQTAGVVQMTYTGTAPTPGYAVLAATGSASVKTDTASPAVGGEYLVLAVDTGNKKVTFVL